MDRFSILLINNQISTAATLVRTVGQHLATYRLVIVRNIVEATAEPESVHVILLNTELLSEVVSDCLTSLTTAYPGVPILLLQEEPSQAGTSQPDILLKALEAGAKDYFALSEAGQLVLGRKLAALSEQHSQAPLKERPLEELVDKVFDTETAQLAIQLIGPDNRVRAWNRAAETFFGFKGESAVGCRLEDLPLSVTNLSRLKDILDEARISRTPFSVANFPLEDEWSQSRWGKVYVYPITKDQNADGNQDISDIFIISVDVSDLKQIALENQYHNQELQILLEISRTISEQLDLKSTLEKIVEQTKSLFNADNCWIYFLEKDNQLLQPVLAIGPHSKQIRQIPLTVGEGVLGSVAATGQAAMVNYAHAGGESLFGHQIDISPPHDEHILVAAMAVRRRIIGLIAVSKNRQPPFTTDDLNFFESMVQQASWAISNARLFEETQRNLNELALFYEASATISTTWNTQEVLTTLIRQMVQGMAVSRGHIVSWDKIQKKGTIQAIFLSDDTMPVGDAKFGATFNLEERPALSVIIQQQRPVFFQLKNTWLDQAEREDMRKQGCLSRLLVPLVVKGETIGWAELWEMQEERSFTTDEIRLVRMLANQAAVALENARYLKQTQQTLEETTALYEVANALASTQDSQSIMTTVLEEYLRVLNLKQGTIIIFDFEAKVGIVKVSMYDEEVVLSAEENGLKEEFIFREGQEIDLKDNPIYTRLMRTRQPVKVEDTQADWLRPVSTGSSTPAPAIGGGWGRAGTLSLLVTPIQIRGETIGAIVAEATRQKHTFTHWEISLGQTMADQLGIALQNVELYELEYLRRQQAETLREVSFIVGSSLNLNEVLDRILDQLRRVVKYDSAAIHLIEGKNRRVIAGRGFPHPERNIGLVFPVKLDPQEPGSLAINTRQPLVIGNIPEIYTSFKEPPHDHIKSWMGIPLIARDRVIGLITIDNTEINAYDDGDVNLALAFANQVAIALENARLYEIEVRQLERELEIAQGIQETLLPQVVPRVPGLDISGRILPAQQIGGDFFHFFFQGQDQFGVAVGDVSGKGIPAALYMAVAMTAIDAQMNDNLRPGELLNKLQRVLYNRLQENKMNVGLQVATFTPHTISTNGRTKNGDVGKLLTLASAGMIAPIVATKDGCQFVPVSGLPIGTPISDVTYDENEVVLEPFTAIIFTSDGIVEARNEAGELFGFDRLEQTINEVVGSQRAETIADHIIHTAQQFTGDAEQSDDMTVVVVMVKS